MNAGGWLLVFVGVLVISQITIGGALERTGVLS